jgi:hypothetical protein
MFSCFYLTDEGWFYSLYVYSPIKDVIARFGWIVSELMYSFDMITHSVMSVNRFTAVYFPTKYDKVIHLFVRYYRKILIFLKGHPECNVTKRGRRGLKKSPKIMGEGSKEKLRYVLD